METIQNGLEGVVVAKTRLSHVDGDAGALIIAGQPVEALADAATFEQACARSELDTADRLWREIAAEFRRRPCLVPEAQGRRLALAAVLLGHQPGAFAAAPSR